MKAVGFTHYLLVEDTNAFLDPEIETPPPTGRDILVTVKAIAVNPVDTKVRGPKDKVEETLRVIGYDASGIVRREPDLRCSRELNGPTLRSRASKRLPESSCIL